MSVYIIQAGSRFKIGKANDIHSRVNQAKSFCPYEIKVICIIEEECAKKSHQIEGEIHSLFKDRKAKGEWFVLSESDFKAIKQKYKVGYFTEPTFIENGSDLMREINQLKDRIEELERKLILSYNEYEVINLTEAAYKSGKDHVYRFISGFKEICEMGQQNRQTAIHMMIDIINQKSFEAYEHERENNKKKRK